MITVGEKMSGRASRTIQPADTAPVSCDPTPGMALGAKYCS